MPVLVIADLHLDLWLRAGCDPLASVDPEIWAGLDAVIIAGDLGNVFARTFTPLLTSDQPTFGERLASQQIYYQVALGRIEVELLIARVFGANKSDHTGLEHVTRDTVFYDTFHPFEDEAPRHLYTRLQRQTMRRGARDNGISTAGAWFACIWVGRRRKYARDLSDRFNGHAFNRTDALQESVEHGPLGIMRRRSGQSGRVFLFAVRRHSAHISQAASEVGQRAVFMEATMVCDQFGFTLKTRSLFIGGEDAIYAIMNVPAVAVNLANDVTLEWITLANRMRAQCLELMFQHPTSDALSNIENPFIWVAEFIDVERAIDTSQELRKPFLVAREFHHAISS
ncbi:MAG: hypothetical protein KGZ72_12050 [Roseovarius sp.]|jgi:hypothetical protein|nr:hypothetical protein [Roseovarius sp.]